MVQEVLEILDNGVCLYGADLDMSIGKMWIHTMEVKDLLNHVHDGQLAILSANRIDAAMLLLLEAQSSNVRNISLYGRIP